VLDLDGTLVRTDTLVESAIAFIKQSPFHLFLLAIWVLQGKAFLKAALAQRVSLDTNLLPYRTELVDYARQARAEGRTVVLATAAHHSIAQSVAQHLGIFERVLASSAEENLKGSQKLARIQAEVGSLFTYAGDSKADLPIWANASGAIVAGGSQALEQRARSLTTIEHQLTETKSSAVTLWAKALRVHQWLKNLLLFVPLLTAFQFTELEKVGALLIAFLAFSLGASATYIVNDLWDLDNDRAHPRKRQRPFASGALPILHGVLVAAVLMGAAFALAAGVGPVFLIALVAYVVATSAYSWVLKRFILVDVLMLSALYTTRIIAGGLAISAPLTSWMLVFSVFIFLSLALVKRCAELVVLRDEGKLAAKGRDYRVSDLTVLWPLGVGSALSAVVVFGLFISTPETAMRYAIPDLLWFVAAGLVYWLGRLWIVTARGEMHDDPIVFALKDKASQLTISLMVCTVLVAHLGRWN
jgi:4-hydroxybenzoate polyprenyltransferase/phosphoserine phosphatase